MKVKFNNIIVADGENINLNKLSEEMGVSKEDFVIEYSVEEKKLNTDYNGVSVSLTSKDALGLLQVKTAFELGVTKTNFKFQNGTVMEMTPEVFGIFAPWFAEKRNEFFV